MELNHEFKIIIDNEVLNYSSIIEENLRMEIEVNGKKFNCRYLRWNVKPNDEFSRFYFLNESLDVKGTKTTLLNKKGDNFWHSIVVTDNFLIKKCLKVEQTRQE